MELEDVKKAFGPYSELWFKWKYSESCFLSKEEIILVETYVNTGSIQTAQKRLKISSRQAVNKLNASTFKLIYFENRFFEWMFEEFFRQSVSWFIHRPITKIPLPYHLREKLILLGGFTLSDIFERYTLFDFYNLWPKADADEFIQLMETYQCKSLIRTSSNN